jgi:hypothetical protein
MVRRGLCGLGAASHLDWGCNSESRVCGLIAGIQAAEWHARHIHNHYAKGNQTGNTSLKAQLRTEIMTCGVGKSSCIPPRSLLK